jgi:S-adenosyl methyltransferase
MVRHCDDKGGMSVTSTATDDGPKPATAARIYDYLLGGTHNFPADREAAKELVRLAPWAPAIARANRAFLRRAVRFLADSGVRQFLDIGSGIPTAGNVHEVAQVVPDARVVYVDIDPVAVAESLDILHGNNRATALRGDLRDPETILNHPDVRRLIAFDEPVGVLLVSVLHFVPDDTQAYGAVDRFVGAVAPGSYLVMSHGSLAPDAPGAENVEAAEGLYKTRTATPVFGRDRAGVERFFARLEFVEPGLVYAPSWRPAPEDPTDFADNPTSCAVLAGVARV